MIKLTERQQQILNLIQIHIQQYGMPPTRAEISKKLGFKSINAAEDHLRALERKGAISLSAGTSRGIRLIQELNQEDAPTEDITPHLTIPLIGRVAAGSPILATEHIETHIPVAEHLFNPKPDYFLKVKGLSMKDIGILDNDLLAVKKTQNAYDGQIIVARIAEEVTVKRLRRQGHIIELLPENPDFEPIIIDARYEECTIEGIAVGLLRTRFN